LEIMCCGLEASDKAARDRAIDHGIKG